MGENSEYREYRILEGGISGKPGIWKSNMKMDLEEIGWM
jgi:hypothetical protein